MPYIEDFSYTSRRTTQTDGSRSHLAGLIDGVKANLRLLNPVPDGDPDIQAQLDKVESLKLVTIPMPGGGESRYYSIADSAGGVTAKTCLIDEANLIITLQELALARSIDHVRQNKIRMNAILKHPKAGEDVEVQREAIGLKIASILGFDHVTDNILVSHDIGNGQGEHPCLFVPFAPLGTMQLLTESIENAASMEGRLRAEHFPAIEDFGKYSAFFMLCSDPDFIGKAGQNKGLTGDRPTRLYLFDQVFMTGDNLGFDKAFNLVPTRFLSKLPDGVARHFMGRNKSVINDSSFEEKIQGAIGVLQHKEEIRHMFEDIERANAARANDPVVKKLREDAKACLKKFDERVSNIEKLFPTVQINGEPKSVGELVAIHDDANLILVKKAMLLNQLINKPQLFDAAGKPYRAPFFNGGDTSVKDVSILGGNVVVSFNRRFGPPLSEDKKALLAQHGFMISADGKSATIPTAGLLQINEQSYLKEQENTIAPGHDYLDPNRINVLAKTYGEDGTKVQQLIAIVSRAPDKAAALQRALNQLNELPIKNGGFAAHVKQCFLYEAMKVIIERDPAQRPYLEGNIQAAKQAGALEELVRNALSPVVAPLMAPRLVEPITSLSATSHLQQSAHARFATARDDDSEMLELAALNPAPITQEMRDRYAALSALIVEDQLPTRDLQEEYDALHERFAAAVSDSPELLSPPSSSAVTTTDPQLPLSNEPDNPTLH